MKKLMILVVAAMAMTTVYSMPTWALVNTDKATTDVTGDIASYSAYLWKLSEASKYLGGKADIGEITDYLTKSGVDYDNLKASTAAMGEYGVDDGELSFSKYFNEGSLISGDDYLALVTYLDGQEGEMFQVIRNAVDGYGELTLDSSVAGAAGGWAQAVPEPTSAMLLLFGLAGLALKRKRD